ncbi:baseplate J/gp47 family protein [Parasegetibacter sp. NRK P23]|uniref:baseplate assembly protein n=1 Tax=Parasegetibacter sp. NRK P23 TaxID=2942999 RepID=UPI002042FDFC|nr:baseplate J/gp47 family protein [Parasegetibacter sp. NRK P23]MCM5528974.1 baseplate J/gp47 family protein [Parasegetibacter sp. NRK P23]
MADQLPSIFEEAVQNRLTRIQQRLEVNLGRPLAPGDVEMLIANSFVYEMQLQAIAGNEAFRQSMVKYSVGASLENLGELVGVKRLPSAGAETTIQFTLTDGHLPIQIPQGTRVQSEDGVVVFTTNNAVDVPIGINTVVVTALCQTAGVIGNGYEPGKVSIILDPVAFVSTAQNTTVTSGGNNSESDDQLRERIKLAPSSFSVAGPRGAYEFFAKSAHPSIVDVAVITTQPGEVTIYPLCDGGVLPSTEILASILSICDDEKVRPQNDTVLVDEPIVVEYEIEVQLTTYTGAINSEVESIVNQNLETFRQERNNRLGMDVVRNQINGLCMIKDKVYNATIVSPASDIVADEKTYPKCTGISVTITGSNDG